jgi:glycerol kinase
VVFVPAFTGLGAPHWDPYASGMIIGLQRSTEIGHIARAATESIAFQVADVLEAMNRDTRQPFRELRVDGGAAANDLLMQFQADLLQLPVRRPAVLETTAQGAAYLAGLAVNFWSSIEEIAKLRAEDTVFEPKADRQEMDARQAKWRDAVKRAGGWNRKSDGSN